jgi:TRAP-type C4-dicarboxylate transport system permease small subunit
MNRWDKLDENIARVEKILVVVFLSSLMLTAFLQIILRNFFASGISWGDVLIRYLVLWVAFIGAALATREGKHINMEVFSRWISNRGKKYLNRLSHLCSAGICGLLTYAAIKFIQFEAQMGSMTILELPIWVPELIIPLTFGLMTFRYALRFFNSFNKVSNPDTKRQPDITQ